MDINYDKQYAVFESVNESTDLLGMETDNLIHESGRLELNTYQAFVKNLMNPMSDLRSLLLVHMTGTGKTITALATATEYVKQYQSNVEDKSISSIIVLGYTKDIFKKEILSHPEFEFVSIEDAEQLKDLESHMHESSTIADQYQMKKRQFQKRLSKRDVNGIYQFYGYRQFANRVINVDDVRNMIKERKTNNTIDSDEPDLSDFDPKLLKTWIDSGKVRLNVNFIKSLAKSFVICDEVHNLYKLNILNTYGIAIQCMFDYFFKTLPEDDINYGSLRSLLLSATPLTSSALEIIPIVSLLTSVHLPPSEIFKDVDGVDQLTPNGSAKIRQILGGKVSYIMDDNPKEYPSSSFAGEYIKNIDYVKFVRTKPSGVQLNYFKHWQNRLNGMSEERGTNMVKDIVLPATNEHKNGVIFSRNIADLSELPKNIAVYKSQSGIYSSNIFQLKELSKYSSKYAKLVEMCLNMKGKDHGKLFIYHPFIQGSGTDLIVSILLANGFIMNGDIPTNDSICMNCNVKYAKHSGSIDHSFNPVVIDVITGYLSKSTVATILNEYNSESNIYGEKLKIIIGSKAMRESHTLKACRHVIITHEPGSISEMIQIVGRAVRKKVHQMLPVDMRSVLIHVITTNVSDIDNVKKDPTANEELSYKFKVMQYVQINKIERIMYDISIDYLINFRFKMRETPILLGEPFELDNTAHKFYQDKLTKEYANLRNGISLKSLATNRFNVFYLEGEVRVVVMIIKRILLDHQYVISIREIRNVIREPPFGVEYNTKLISDESISCALSKIVFSSDQVRMILSDKTNSLVSSLYDQSSLLVDREGRQYHIVCVGDIFCYDSYLLRRLKASILERDDSMIDSFKNKYTPKKIDAINLFDIGLQIANSIDVLDIVEDLLAIQSKNKKNVEEERNSILKNISRDVHARLAEWVIQSVVDYVMKSKKIKDIEILKYLINYYYERRLIFKINELTYTKIYDRYKRLDVNTGSDWTNKSMKVSTATMPIGHIIRDDIKIYQPSDSSWLELNSLSLNNQSKHAFDFYIYEERLKDSMNVVLKVKYTTDLKSKGITMIFLQKPELYKIAKALKMKVPNDISNKEMIIKLIEDEAWKMQSKIYPKRIIYRAIDM